MSNTSNDKVANLSVNQTQISPEANVLLPNQETSRVEPSVPINVDHVTASRQSGGLLGERSASSKEGPAPAGNVDIGGPSKSAAIEDTLPLSQHAAQVAEGQGDRQVSAPVPSASVAAHPPSAAAPASMNFPSGVPETISQSAGQVKAATQADSAIPPGRPPAPVVSCPDEPKPTAAPLPASAPMPTLTPTPVPTPTKKLGNSAPPPVFDVEEFIREAEDSKRGAKTLREIAALADDIRVIRERGVPVSSIHKGLRRKGLVTCSRSRFDEICAELLPDLFKTKRRDNA